VAVQLQINHLKKYKIFGKIRLGSFAGGNSGCLRIMLLQPLELRRPKQLGIAAWGRKGFYQSGALLVLEIRWRLQDVLSTAEQVSPHHRRADKYCAPAASAIS